MKEVKYLILFIGAFFFNSCKENSVETIIIPEQTIYKILFSGTASGSSGLFIIDSNGENSKKIADFNDCYAPKFTPDGGKILYLRGGGSVHELFIMDADGNNEQKIADGVECFAVSPEGSRLCYVHYDSGWEIFMCGMDGSGKTKLTNTQRQKFGLYWSPVNPEIAFTENDNLYGSYENIHRMKVDTGILDTLAAGYELPQISDWSKDGNFILFGANHAEVYKIYLVSGEITQLTNAAYRDERASFSPDGKKILFETGRESGIQVYIMNGDGSDQHRVSKYSGGCMYPKWSPDGTSISYLTNINNMPSLVIADSYGNNEKLLVPDSLSFQVSVDWHPLPLK